MQGWIARAAALVLILGLMLAAINFEPLLDRVAPFELEQPPNFLTPLHLYLMSAKPASCYAALERGNVAFTRAPSDQRDDGCGYSDAALLQCSGVSYGSRVLLRRPAMAALLLWERHVLGPAAEEHLGQKVTAVRSLGTCACRNINRANESRLSEHATANAIDIAGFTFADGSRVTLLQDWSDAEAKGRFLRAVRDGACALFGAVLSLDFNAEHRNHFHFDMGLGRVCR